MSLIKNLKKDPTLKNQKKQQRKIRHRHQAKKDDNVAVVVITMEAPTIQPSVEETRISLVPDIAFSCNF